MLWIRGRKEEDDENKEETMNECSGNNINQPLLKTLSAFISKMNQKSKKENRKKFYSEVWVSS